MESELHRSVGHDRMTDSPPRRTRLYERSWAVVVGIDEYQATAIPDLRYAVADARAVGHALRRLGFDVTELFDQRATRPQVERTLTMLARDMGVDDRFVLFLAGHGAAVRIDGLSDQHTRRAGFFLCHDSDISSANWDGATELTEPPLSAMAMDYFSSQLRDLRAKHRVLLLDACASGFALTRGGADQNVESALEALTARPVIQVLTAGKSWQGSFESDRYGHSVFSHHLLTALTPGDSPLLFSTVAAYVHGAVIQEIGMCPEFGRTYGDGEFVFWGGPDAQVDASLGPSRRRKFPANPTAGERWVSDELGAMVWIPQGGTVSTPGFWMDEFPVTNRQFQRFVAACPDWRRGGRLARTLADHDYLRHWTPNGPPVALHDHPVVWVSWHAATAYAAWASKRLPTDSEWEYAAQAGTSTAYWWGETFNHSLAVVSPARKTAPSDERRRNPWGGVDLLGNVWEWTASEHHGDHESSRRRVLRGGSFAVGPDFVRLDSKDLNYLNVTDRDYGFRCVMNAPAL